MPRIKSYQTSYLLAQKGSSFIVPAPTVREGLKLLLSALQSIGHSMDKGIVCTMVKRSIFLNGGERIVAQVPVPITQKMLDKAISSL